MAPVSESLRRPGVVPAAADAAAVLAVSINLDPFRLAGGTALAWHLGHRLSEDLDFFSFSPGAIQTAGVAQSIEVIAEPGSVRVSERTLHARVKGCSVSFFEVEGRWFDPLQRVAEGFTIASVPEIGAMKLVAVMTRCAKKDFYDLVAIAEHGVRLRQMVEDACRMYPGFIEALPHLLRSLAYFGGRNRSRSPEYSPDHLGRGEAQDPRTDPRARLKLGGEPRSLWFPSNIRMSTYIPLGYAAHGRGRCLAPRHRGYHGSKQS